MKAQIYRMEKSSQSLLELEANIINLAQRINSSQYDFLVAVREFDLRQGWKPYQLNNCAEWLNLRCGIVPATAREKIRTAHALYDLPEISRAFSAGEISYSNVRAITRAATPANEESLLKFAFGKTAIQVEEHCRKLRNVMRAQSQRDAEEIFNSRFLSCTYLPDGGISIHMELPSEDGELVLKAVERLSQIDELPGADNTGDTDKERSFSQSQADAMVGLARHYLTGNLNQQDSSSNNYKVVVHVNESSLSHRTTENSAMLRDAQSTSDLPIETMRRITCDSSLVSVLEDGNGNPLNVGRKRRVVSPRVRHALISRDKGCRFPSCGHKKWLEAHHVTHWADGGETSMDNLLLFCSRHHRLLHEGGFTISTGDHGETHFKTRAGRILSTSTEFVREPEMNYWVKDVSVG